MIEQDADIRGAVGSNGPRSSEQAGRAGQPVSGQDAGIHGRVLDHLLDGVMVVERGGGAQRRAILVEAPVSSTKTSLSGSRAGWASNQARRRCSTSGRCCALACAFF